MAKKLKLEISGGESETVTPLSAVATLAQVLVALGVPEDAEATLVTDKGELVALGESAVLSLSWTKTIVRKPRAKKEPKAE